MVTPGRPQALMMFNVVGRNSCIVFMNVKGLMLVCAVHARVYRAREGIPEDGKIDAAISNLDRGYIHLMRPNLQRYSSALKPLLSWVHVGGLVVGHWHPSFLILVPETAARVGDAVPDDVRDLGFEMNQVRPDHNSITLYIRGGEGRTIELLLGGQPESPA